jgi:WD40 repeat protein
VSRRVSTERENCCDDLVVSAGCDRVQYASTLIRVAEVYAALTNRARAPQATALAATGTRQTEFRRRVLRLLASEPRIRFSRGGALAALVLLLALLVVPLTAPHWIGAVAADDEVRSATQQNNQLEFEQNAEEAAPPVPTSPSADHYGDPLPQGAVLRLGTARFQSRWRTGRIAFSPDGKWIASTGAHRSLRIWDLSTGKRVTEIKEGTMSQQGTAIAFSHDGRYLAMGGDDGLVQVFSVPAGEEIFSERQVGVGRHVSALAFAPSGILASAGERGEVRLWDVASGTETDVLTHVSDEGGRDMRLAFSPNGELLASSCHNNIRIWRLGEEPECTYIALAHEHEVSNLVFTPDGKSLITAGHTFETPQTPPQSQLRVWDAETGQRRGELFEEVGAYFSGLSVRDNGQTLIAATQNRVFLFDLSSASLRWSFEINGPFTSASSEWSDVSPDGETFAYTRWDSAIRLLDLTSGASALPERESHEAMVRAVAYSPDGNRIVTGSGDGTVRIWDAASGRQLHRLEFSPRCMNFFAVAYSHDERLVAAAGDFNREAERRQVGLVKVWNALTGEPWHEFQLEGTAYFNVAFSNDGSLLAAAPHPMPRLEPGQDPLPVHQSIDVFRMDNGRKLVSLAGHSRTSTAIAFTPGDEILASVGRDKAIRNWKLPGGEPIATHSIDDASTAAFSPDATIVATSTGLPLYRVTTRDVATGEAIHKIQTNSGFGAHAMDISDDGKLLATGCQEETIFVWDMASGRQLLKIHSPDATVFALAFDPTGERLVTGMDDGTALVWDVSGAALR